MSKQEEREFHDRYVAGGGDLRSREGRFYSATAESMETDIALDFLGDIHGKRLLFYGSGGHFSLVRKFIQLGSEVVAIDISPETVAGLRHAIEGLFMRSREWDPLSRMLYFDTKTWLVDHLLIKADRMSMATSIELRVPFLDHRLVEHAAAVPSRHKIRGIDTKFILKKILEGRLPQSILQRRKMGFPTPLEIMFRGELFSYAHEILLSKEATDRGYFERREVERLLLDHRSGKAENGREIW